MSNRPETITMRSTGDLSLDREMNERADFEEKNFVRVNLTRDQKKKLKHAQLDMQRGRKIGVDDEWGTMQQLARQSEQIANQVIEEGEDGLRYRRLDVGDGPANRSNKRPRNGFKGGKGKKRRH